MKTNLSVELTCITPELAKNYLTFNKNNRSLKSNHVTFLSGQIKKGLFLENGESIVFDKNGILKDGQHRLKAISINDKSFYIPVVRGVESDVMATYDTGKNRSAADVLKLNGYKYYATLAGAITAIDKYVIRKSKGMSGLTHNRRNAMSNLEVLDYAKNNYHWLIDIVSNTDSVSGKMKPKVLNPSAISLITYIIGGETPNDNVYEFIKHLTGVVKTESSAPLYVYNKLYNSKINKEPLNFYWVLGMSLKAWNYYNEGNPAIKYFRFDVSSKLPKISK